MSETAVNVPFEAGEVIDIVADELKTRMRGLSPLQSNKEYAAFSVDFQVKIRLRRSGESVIDARETLAWGSVGKGEFPFEIGGPPAEFHGLEDNHFDSKDPNDERMARDMPMTVETKDGKGGRVRRKVRMKGK